MKAILSVVLYRCQIIKLTLVFTATVLISCQREPDVEDVIKEYLKNNMNDPSSYEPVSFGYVDTINISFEEKYPTLVDARKDHVLTGDSVRISRIDSLRSVYESSDTRYYRVIHKYRGKNSFGALILKESMFLLNSDLKVYEVVDL